jgi:putative addiction module component (TIGR02574 family)
MIEAMHASDAILAEALKLPEEERARVALRLSESLSGLPDVRANEAWAGEIARRIARLHDGTARTVTADEALSRARARLATRRA